MRLLPTESCLCHDTPPDKLGRRLGISASPGWFRHLVTLTLRRIGFSLRKMVPRLKVRAPMASRWMDSGQAYRRRVHARLYLPAAVFFLLVLVSVYGIWAFLHVVCLSLRSLCEMSLSFPLLFMCGKSTSPPIVTVHVLRKPHPLAS